MQQDLLPLFPLGVVLLPRTPLPLHIFEDRYKEMIGEAIASNSEFGIVLASENGIVNIGCSARVEKVLRQYEDGQMDILTIGIRRFEILLLNQERSFLRGAVHYFEDESDDPGATELKKRVYEMYLKVRAVSEEQEPLEANWGDRQLSFLVGSIVRDLNFRQILLATRSETERLRQLSDYLPKLLESQRHAAHVREKAPRNGHAHSPNLPPS